MKNICLQINRAWRVNIWRPITLFDFHCGWHWWVSKHVYCQTMVDIYMRVGCSNPLKSHFTFKIHLHIQVFLFRIKFVQYSQHSNMELMNFYEMLINCERLCDCDRWLILMKWNVDLFFCSDVFSPKTASTLTPNMSMFWWWFSYKIDFFDRITISSLGFVEKLS